MALNGGDRWWREETSSTMHSLKINRSSTVHDRTTGSTLQVIHGSERFGQHSYQEAGWHNLREREGDFLSISTSLGNEDPTVVYLLFPLSWFYKKCTFGWCCVEISTMCCQTLNHSHCHLRCWGKVHNSKFSWYGMLITWIVHVMKLSAGHKTFNTMFGRNIYLAAEQWCWRSLLSWWWESSVEKAKLVCNHPDPPH